MALDQQITERQETDSLWLEREMPSLATRYAGKWLMVHKESVAGVFDSAGEAYREGTRLFGIGEFVIGEATDVPAVVGGFH